VETDPELDRYYPASPPHNDPVEKGEFDFGTALPGTGIETNIPVVVPVRIDISRVGAVSKKCIQFGARAS
jgi:hypothetical protein